MKSLPVWSLESIYPSLESKKYQSGLAACKKNAGQLTALVKGLPRLDAERLEWLAGYIRLFSLFSDQFESLYAYAYMCFSIDTNNYQAVNRMNELDEIRSPVKTSLIEFREVLSSLDCSLAECGARMPDLERHSFFIREQLMLKKHQMSKPEEELAEELSRTGGEMWGRLQEAVSSTLSAPWPGKGFKTVTELRSFAADGDRMVRKKAFELELSAWETAKSTLSFAINGVKGFSTVLNRKRHYADTKSRSVIQARMSEASLSALVSSMQDSLPDFRTYLKAKARFLGVKKCAFFDLFAPIGGKQKAWTFGQAQQFILEQFSGFSAKLGGFAQTAFDANWIDAMPRSGKVGGAYCISLPLQKSSRIMCNFNNTFSAVTTVAHELGHAYHHHILKNETSILRDYPMTLAETASIFSENIIFDGALKKYEKAEKIGTLEHFLQDATQVIVDILSRYLFETWLMEQRSSKELSPDELCALMIRAQKETYGDALDEKYLHPYMWAVKGHYYRQNLAFYNFPYAFGLLFGLALFSRFKSDGKKFAAEYDRILGMTGRMTCVDLTKSLGYDIESPDFWKSGLSVITARIREFDLLSRQIKK